MAQGKVVDQLLRATPYSQIPQKRKGGPRASVACESCRRLKAKCDQNTPCCVCVTNSLDCVYRSRPKQAKTAREKSFSSNNNNNGRDGTKRLFFPPAIAPKTLDGSVQSPPQEAVTKRRPYDAVSQFKRPLKPNQDIGRDLADYRPSIPQISSPLSSGEEPIARAGTADYAPEKDGISQAYGRRQQQPPEMADDQETSPRGFGEVNNRTNGKEFYGPAATLAFLLELRRRVRAFHQQTMQSKIDRSAPTLKPGDRASSIVNFLHGDDNILPAELPDSNDEVTGDGIMSVSGPSTSSPMSPVDFPPNRDIERVCINLYFANLHLIYFFIDRAAFEDRCKAEIWSQDYQTPSARRRTHRNSKFPALYNAVVAVGALTAGDDTFVGQDRDHLQEFLHARSSGAQGRTSISTGPLALASVHFAEAKDLLGDMFESCCLESQQTLFLMSVYCQYALKPHGSYLYSGMSARTALAIGSANEPNLRENPLEAVRTWWAMYYHEFEVCCSLGRESSLREPSYYPVFMAKFGEPMPKDFGRDDDQDLFFARSMTELAYILNCTMEEIYHDPSKSLEQKSRDALALDDKLLNWRCQLAPIYDLDKTSLTEKESTTKRKVVLKLRFYSARILIHRTSLLHAAFSKTSGKVMSNVDRCLSAARETIHLLHDTFINRPFFRTWWYNTTWAFNAITIILYVLVSRLKPENREDLLSDVEKTLSIFRAMDGIRVARRCADLTEEIFQIIKMLIRDQSNRRQGFDGRRQPASWETGGMPQASSDHLATTVQDLETQPALEGPPGDSGWSLDNVNDDIFYNFMDVNFMDNFDANLSAINFDGSPFGTSDVNWSSGDVP